MNNIKIIKGNIFNTKVQTIVNTINCVGVMGRGIALVFKLRYPKMFDLYKEHCNSGLISIGKLWIYKNDSEQNPSWVLNFPTKDDWKNPSKIEYVEQGLQKFVSTYKEKGITSIAFPMLGTANGGLNEKDVLELMKKYLTQCDIPIEIYQYDSNASDDLFDTFKNRWNSLSVEEKKKLVRTTKQREIIDNALIEVNSIIKLIEYKGIGEQTLKKCFDFVMNDTVNSPKTKPNLF
ncbi:MAG: macro domain-containing protein [Bacteroidales bacterium]|nr:macro domain-containing protein [Bacteroidales bacterium]